VRAAIQDVCHFNRKRTRVRKKVRLALVENTSKKDAHRQAGEHLRPMNQGLETIGVAVNFQHYVEKHYIPLVMPLMAKSTQSRSMGVLDNYLIPTFGDMPLRQLSPMTLQSLLENGEQMRHSRASTTLDIYQQFVPESQQRVVEKLSKLVR